jgi:hypothetical protein
MLNWCYLLNCFYECWTDVVFLTYWSVFYYLLWIGDICRILWCQKGPLSHKDDAIFWQKPQGEVSTLVVFGVLVEVWGFDNSLDQTLKLNHEFGGTCAFIELTRENIIDLCMGTKELDITIYKCGSCKYILFFNLLIYYVLNYIYNVNNFQCVVDIYTAIVWNWATIMLMDLLIHISLIVKMSVVVFSPTYKRCVMIKKYVTLLLILTSKNIFSCYSQSPMIDRN